MAPSRGLVYSRDLLASPPVSAVLRACSRLPIWTSSFTLRTLFWVALLIGFYSAFERLAETRVAGNTRLTFVDFGSATKSSSEAVPILILTPLKNAAPYLAPYFENLARLSYPKHLISLGFLVSDSTDGTYDLLASMASQLAAQGAGLRRERYASISVLKRDFHFGLAAEARHAYESQPVRRAFLARARNYLLTATLSPEHQWVLWLDVDVIRYDPFVLTDLMAVGKDVTVPNCLWLKQDGWEFWGFDRNAWQETEASLSLLSSINPSQLLVEGYSEFPTHRLHLVDMPTHFGTAYVPLDGVGATFLLVRAAVHREGAMFPTFTFEHEIETEGFAKMAKKMGFEVVGVPGVLVFHSYNG